MVRIIFSLLSLIIALRSAGQHEINKWDSLVQNDKVITIPCEFNSNDNDYSPILLQNGHILFTSDRVNPKTREASLAHNQNIYEYNPENGKVNYSYFYNSDDHSAIAGNSADGKNIIVYKSLYNGNIYISNGKNRKEKLKKFISPGLAVNSDDFKEQSAAIWQNFIVFSSARKDDPNDFDLYFAMMDKNYKVNSVTLISELSTANPEVDVRFMSDGTLLFSSKKDHLYKPFYSIFDGNKWSAPKEIPFIPEKFSNNSIRDLVVYDSIFYFSANSFETEQFDVYQSKWKKDSIFPEPDTIAEILPDTLTPFEQKLEDLQEKLDSIGFKPYRAFVQVGAYRFVRTIEEFKARFPAFNETPLFTEEETNVKAGEKTIIRYIIDKTYYTLKEAAIRQQEALQQQADPSNLYESPVDAFIAVYDNQNVRIVIFFNLEKKEYKILVGDKVVYF